MSFEAIRKSIEGRMATWGQYPVEYDGHATPPPVAAAQAAKTPWVRLTIQSGDSFVAGIGSGPCVSRTGLVFLQIFTKPNTGTAEANRVADSLVEHFQTWQDGPLETQAMSMQRVGEQDGYWQTNLQAPFRYD